MLAQVSAYTEPNAVGVAAPTLTPVKPAPQPKKQRAHTSPVPLLTTKQLASTRILSVAPAPINTVFTQAAAPGKVPITVLPHPVVIKQPAQEPMAWMNDEGFGLYPTNDTAIPLYTHPAPSWPWLDDNDIIKIYVNEWDGNYIKFARAIERALKEKNEI